MDFGLAHLRHQRSRKANRHRGYLFGPAKNYHAQNIQLEGYLHLTQAYDHSTTSAQKDTKPPYALLQGGMV
jgi:hypothetical protein